MPGSIMMFSRIFLFHYLVVVRRIPAPHFKGIWSRPTPYCKCIRSPRLIPWQTVYKKKKVPDCSLFSPLSARVVNKSETFYSTNFMVNLYIFWEFSKKEKDRISKKSDLSKFFLLFPITPCLSYSIVYSPSRENTVSSQIFVA